MPPGYSHRPPLAMKLWLWQRFGRNKESEPSSAAPAHTLTSAMSLEALEHTLRNRIRAFFRHTQIVTILGTIILGGLIWTAVHVTLAPTQMRVAAGPPGSADVKFVEMLSHKFAVEHDNVQLHLVSTDGPKASAAAIANGEADLAVVVPHHERTGFGVHRRAGVVARWPRIVGQLGEGAAEARDEILFAHGPGFERPFTDFSAYFIGRALARSCFAHLGDQRG